MSIRFFIRLKTVFADTPFLLAKRFAKPFLVRLLFSLNASLNWTNSISFDGLPGFFSSGANSDGNQHNP